MRRDTIRTILRRRLNDTAKDQFPNDGELDDIINVALGLVQAEILKVKRYAFLQWELLDLVLNQQRYQFPVGTCGPVYVGTRQSVSDEFVAIERQDLNKILRGEATGYAHAGREIVVFPKTPTSVSQGLRIIHIPTLELSADATTTEDKGIPRPLDFAVAVWAYALLNPETGESRGELDRELGKLLENVPILFPADTDGAQVLQVELVKYPMGVK